MSNHFIYKQTGFSPSMSHDHKSGQYSTIRNEVKLLTTEKFSVNTKPTVETANQPKHC